MEVNLQEININEQVEFVYSFFKPEIEKKWYAVFIKKFFAFKRRHY